MISSQHQSTLAEHISSSFHLAIEVLLISSLKSVDATLTASIKFQSRNRDSFDFKIRRDGSQVRPSRSFNLAIEILLISSAIAGYKKGLEHGKFQSRNRGSFDFKDEAPIDGSSIQYRFQSRNRDSFDFKEKRKEHLIHAFILVSISQSRFF